MKNVTDKEIADNDSELLALIKKSFDEAKSSQVSNRAFLPYERVVKKTDF